MAKKTFLEFKTTLKFNSELSPKLWSNMKLKDKVRNKLIQIARAWVSYAKIPEEAVEDYILVGGMTGYTYTKYSDIDVHVVVDKSKIAECEDLLDDYLKDKKELWGLRDITVMGHDVELFAQDKDEEFKTAQSVYSLMKNKWLIPPKKITPKMKNAIDDSAIYKKTTKYTAYINSLINDSKNNFEALKKLKDKIKKMRQEGLETGGEFSLNNLVFKELRNLGILDKMNEYMKNTQDDMLSLKSS